MMKTRIAKMARTKKKQNNTRAKMAVNAPINLRDEFGERYKIDYDPAYCAEHGMTPKVDDPWLQIVPGKHGHIYPMGGQLLAAATNHRRGVAKQLLAIPECQVHMDGEDKVTVVFEARHFRKVARTIGARTTRTLSPERRQQLIASGAEHRFQRQRANGSLFDQAVAT
jgi:hypothetical protein